MTEMLFYDGDDDANDGVAYNGRGGISVLRWKKCT